MRLELLSKELLKKEYSFYKKEAYDSYNKKKLNYSLKFIEYCGLIAWFQPILEQFCDEELESLICKITEEHICVKTILEKQTNRIVFYNSQIVDSGGLTEQYLNFFINNNYEVLVVIPDEKFTKSGPDILKRIENSPLITLFVASGKDLIAKIQSIVNKIVSYNPKSAFLHFTPADVVGFASFCNLKAITRYYIVHNDHTFWFGKKCSDYFIEFRKFGYLLATQRRGIEISRIYHLPYYPIKQNIPFQGFPFDPDGKVIGFSGANLYKYYLDPKLKYFYAIKELLLRNPDFVFCLAGFGNAAIIEQFIQANDLNDRFYFLGKRKDFYELTNNIDILFESYPLKGGLTVLYGVENHKAITGIGDNRNASGCLEDFFDLSGYKQPQNIEDFIVEADLLIKSETERKSNVSKFECSKYNRVDFESGLSEIMEGLLPNNYPVYNERFKFDNDYYLKEYLQLPDAEFEFYNRKLFTLKAAINTKERILILIHAFKFNPQRIKNRLARYMILAIWGK